LKAHPAVRVLLVEKTDRLYRNLKDWVTVDELDVEMHLVPFAMNVEIGLGRSPAV
jgi:DNA invertase Pin-like site-specific DNA recombinase